jgi:hypothetical protein
MKLLAAVLALLVLASFACADPVPLSEPIGGGAIELETPAAQPAPELAKPAGVWLPTVGMGNVSWELSIGARFWSDRFHVRNLIAQGELDLGPGLRAHLLVRHNRTLDSLEGFQPNLDEAYLEAYGFYTQPRSTLSGSVRVGKVRYLRFPYLDAIAMFEQVPGVADLQGGQHTGYSGAVLAAEYARASGLGAHVTGIIWGLDGARPDANANIIEDYAFYRGNFGDLHLEARAGGIAGRKEPLGGPAHLGFDAYVGTSFKGYSGGVFYEKREDEPAYTGILFVSTDSKLNRALGTVGFDYTRDPDSFSVQVPLVHGHAGFARKAPAGEPVGVVVAVRERTFWQAGLIRNFYEHRISAWGDTTSRGLIVTIEEKPMYQWAEALVSPHTRLDSKWFRDRQGPAHNARLVIYRFYRPRPATPSP